MDNLGFPVIDLANGFFDMGLAHGRALAREIRSNYMLYLSMIRGFTGFNEERVLEVTRSFVPVIGKTAPEILEEMRGLAEGSGTSLEMIVLLNSRTELISADQLAKECTTIGLTGQRTASGQALLAQNWDWKPELRTTSALFRLTPDKGPRALIFCEAGQVGKIGLNEHGLGVLLNILKAKDGIKPGVPVHVLLRQMMACRNVAEVIDLIERSQRASSTHVLLADQTGRLAGVEFSPSETALLEPEDSALAHTNHFCDPIMADKDLSFTVIPDSVGRYDRARRLISGQRRWELDGIKSILRDHQGSPASICRHLNPGDQAHVQMVTVASIILDLPERCLLIAAGQPCQAEYAPVRL